MSVERDFEQIFKLAYNEAGNYLDLELLGAAVAQGTNLDAEQVMKMVLDTIQNKIRVVEC